MIVQKEKMQIKDLPIVFHTNFVKYLLWLLYISQVSSTQMLLGWMSLPKWTEETRMWLPMEIERTFLTILLTSKEIP